MGEKRSKGGCCGWFIALVILALVVGAVVYAVKKKIDNADSDKPAPVPGPPGAIEQRYASALKIAMQFFDIQKCNNVFSFFVFCIVVGLLLMSLIGYYFCLFLLIIIFCLSLLDILVSMTKSAKDNR